jgi:hypothetical protein
MIYLSRISTAVCVQNDFNAAADIRIQHYRIKINCSGQRQQTPAYGKQTTGIRERTKLNHAAVALLPASLRLDLSAGVTECSEKHGGFTFPF